MFSSHVKTILAQRVEEIFEDIDDPELPDGPIRFILHIDGDHFSSWANIEGHMANIEVPEVLKCNLGGIR